MIVLAKDSGIGMILLGAGLIYFLSRKKNGNGDLLNGGGGNGDEDPLAPASVTPKIPFESKKTGAVTIGMYTKPYVRRKGVLKPVSKVFQISRRHGQDVYMR